MARSIPRVRGSCRICSGRLRRDRHRHRRRLHKVTGDPDNPMFKGYTCAKGRALPAIHNNPERLLHSQKRGADGTFAPIEAQQAMDEIAAKLHLVDREHGPRSVAVYLGTNGLPYPASALMANAFIRAIESPMFFTANTIDQPGKQIALAAHGHWLGGDVELRRAPTAGCWSARTRWCPRRSAFRARTPRSTSRRPLARGMKLIVVDPRRSQTAARAAIHIQPRPGRRRRDPGGLYQPDHQREALRHASSWPRTSTVSTRWPRRSSGFTPEYAAERADVPVAADRSTPRGFSRRTARAAGW